jgi:putative transport protein
LSYLGGLFVKYPELAVYLALGIGFWIGKVIVGGFSLGGTTGALLAGIVIGLLFDIRIPGAAKSLVFLLFLFGIGYEVGPQFVSAMRNSGWRFAVLGIFMPIVGLLVSWMVASALRLNSGFAAGMLSGALTESPAMGTAVEAIQSLDLEENVKQTLIAQVGVADALCYVGGALGVILFCTLIGPRLLKINLREEALQLEAAYGISRTRAGVISAWQPFEYRAYRIAPGAPAASLTVAEAEKRVPGFRLFVERIRRGDEIIDVLPDTRLMAGDVALVSGRREALVSTLGELAEEVQDRELNDIPIASYEVFITGPRVVGRTIEQLAGDDAVRSVFLRRLLRQGNEIPIGTGTIVERGDVMQVVGSEAAVERAIKVLGEVISPTDVTDFVAVALAIFIGAVLGALASFNVGRISVSIGTSVGALIAGIATGYLRSVRPLFGRVPDGAVKFMQSFGLAAFVAMIGIGAGPHFVAGVREAGVSILLGGLLITFTPLFAGLYFGRYVLGINPILLLGAISGAQTFTAGLAAVQEKSGSPIAVLGYSGAVPVAHILLTIWGTVIVLLTAK